MQFVPLKRLKEKAKNKTSRWLLVLFGALWFLVEGTTEHSFFALVNEKYNPLKFLMREAAPAVSWAGSNPILFAVVLGVSYCLAVILWAQFSADGRPQLEIVSLWNGDRVAYQQEVFGVLADCSTSIELRVYAGNAWHRQWPVKVHGNRWRGRCQFGDAKSQAGAPYSVVAIAPTSQLGDKIAELPSGVARSETLSVVRSTPASSPAAPSTGRLQFGELNQVDIGPGVGNRAVLIGIHNVELGFWYKCHNVRAELTFTHSHEKETFKIPGWLASIDNGRISGRPVQALTLDSKERRLTWLILYVESNVRAGRYRFVAPGPPLEPPSTTDWTLGLDDNTRLSFGTWQIRIVVTGDGEDKLERTETVWAP
jgi:hypothetical protein